MRTRANVAIGLALAVLAGIGSLSIRENRNLLEANRWVSHTHEILETSSSLRAHLSDAGMARRLFLQGSEDQITVFRTASRASLADFTTLRKLTVDNADQQKRLDQMEPLVEARLAVLDQSITAHSKVRDDERLQRDLTDQSARLLQQFVERLREFDDTERELLQGRSQSAAESVDKISRIDVGLTLSAFCVIFLAAVAFNRELSQRKQAEREIASQRSLLQAILDTCTDPVVVADSSAKIILRNPAAKRQLGDAVDRISDDSPRVLGFYRSDETTLFSCQDLPLWRAISGERVDNLEMCVRPDDQANARWVLASSGPLLDLNANSRGGVVFYRDITDRKTLESKLANYAQKLECANLELQMAKTAVEQVALVDELTGLHNRRGFLTLADQSLKLVARSQKPFVLIFVDLDGLKEINDRLGHNEGNRAIRDAAMVLMDSCRHSDVLSRLGGDEFAIFMVDADATSAATIKQRLLARVEKLNAERRRPYVLSLSLGGLVCDWSETLPLEALLEKADALMYEDKKKRKTNRTVSSHQVHT